MVSILCKVVCGRSSSMQLYRQWSWLQHGLLSLWWYLSSVRDFVQDHLWAKGWEKISLSPKTRTSYKGCWEGIWSAPSPFCGCSRTCKTMGCKNVEGGDDNLYDHAQHDCGGWRWWSWPQSVIWAHGSFLPTSKAESDDVRILSKRIDGFAIQELMSSFRMIWLGICGFFKGVTKKCVWISWIQIWTTLLQNFMFGL